VLCSSLAPLAADTLPAFVSSPHARSRELAGNEFEMTFDQKEL
jgi:hypothetical protein